MSGIPRPASVSRPPSRAPSRAAATPTSPPSSHAHALSGGSSTSFASAREDPALSSAIGPAPRAATPAASRPSPPNAVQVAVRIRPLTSHDQTAIPARWQRTAIFGDGPTRVRVEPSSGPGTSASASVSLTASTASNNDYAYDRVLAPRDGQSDVYAESVQPLIPKFFEGYNATILAYGQTSSGKSYTMGTASAPSRYPAPEEPSDWDPDTGIIPRAIADIFYCINRDTRPGSSYTLTVSFIELYNEDLIDLLADSDRPAALRPLVQIRQDKGQIVWSGMNEMPVYGVADVMDLLAQGNAVRRTNSTDMNAQSSRSHAIFSLTLTHKRAASLPALSCSSPEATPDMTLSPSSPIGQAPLAPPVATSAFADPTMSPPLGRHTPSRGTHTPTGRTTPGNSRMTAIPRPQSALSRGLPPSPSPTPAVGKGKRSSMFALRTSTSQSTITPSTAGHRGRSISQGTNLLNDGDVLTTVSKFHFVDLAGSERLKRTAAKGERIKEGISINSGLHALGNVISALGDVAKGRKSVHVPYRDSKLTRLLQDSLGGNAHTLMIACVSPAEYNLSETVNTLQYASRARAIKNKAEVNEHEPGWDDLSHVQALVTKLRRDLRDARAGHSVSAGPRGSTLFQGDTREAQETIRQQQDRLAELAQEVAQLNADKTRLTQRVRRQSATLTPGVMSSDPSDEESGKDSFLESAEPVILEYEKSIDVLNGQINLLKAALGHSEDVITDLEQQVAEQENMLADKDRAAEEVGQEITELRGLTAQLSEREAVGSDYASDLEARLHKAEEEHQVTTDVLAQVRKDIARHEQTEQHNESYIQELEARLAQSDVDLSAAKATIDQWESHATKDRSAADAFASLDSSKQDRQLLLAELDARQERIQALETEVVAAKNDQHGSSAKALHSQDKSIEPASDDALASIQTELAELKGKYADAVADLKTAQSAHQETLQRAEVLSSRMAELSSATYKEIIRPRTRNSSSTDDPLEVLSIHQAPHSDIDDLPQISMGRRNSTGTRPETWHPALRSRTESDLSRLLRSGEDSAQPTSGSLSRRSSLSFSGPSRRNSLSGRDAAFAPPSRPSSRASHRRSKSGIAYRPADAPSTVRDLNDLNDATSTTHSGSPVENTPPASKSRHARSASTSSQQGRRPLSLVGGAAPAWNEAAVSSAAAMAEEAQRKILSLERERDTLQSLLIQREDELDKVQQSTTPSATDALIDPRSPTGTTTPLADELAAAGVGDMSVSSRDSVQVQELMTQLAAKDAMHKETLAATSDAHASKLSQQEEAHARALAARDHAATLLAHAHRALQEQYAIAQVAATEAAEQADAAKSQLAQLTRQAEDMHAAHTERLAGVTSDHETALSQKEEAHTKALKVAEDSHARSLELCSQEHFEAMKALKTDYESQLVALQLEKEKESNVYVEARAQLVAEHEQALISIKSDHAEQVKSLRNEHDETIAELKATHEVAMSQAAQASARALVEAEEETEARTAATLRSAHAEAQARADKKHADALAAAETAAAATLTARLAEHKAALTARDEAHSQALREVRDEQAAVLRAAAEQDHARVAQSQEERDSSLANWRSEHAEALHHAQSDHEAALASAMARAKEEHAMDLDRARSDLNDSHARALAAAQAAHESATVAAVAAAATAHDEAHRTALAGATAKHADQLDQDRRTLQAEHEDNMRSVVEKHINTIDSLEQQHKSAWDDREKAHQAEFVKLTESHRAAQEASTAAAAQVAKDHQAALDNFKSDHEASLAITGQQHAQVLADAHVEHEVTLARADEEHAAALNELRKKHDETLKKLMEQHDTQSRTMEAEHAAALQSLMDAAAAKSAQAGAALHEADAQGAPEPAEDTDNEESAGAASIAALQEEHKAELQRQEDAHAKDIEELEVSHAARLAEHVEDTNKRLASLEDARQTSSRKLDELGVSHAQAVASHARELAQRDAQLRRLADEGVSLRQTCDEARASAARHEARTAQLVSQVQVDPVEMDMLKAELAETSDALVVLEGALTEAQSERDQFATELAVLRESTGRNVFGPDVGDDVNHLALARELEAQRSLLSQTRSDLARSRAEAQAAQAECARTEVLLRDTQQRLAQAERNASVRSTGGRTQRNPLDDSTGRVSETTTHRASPSSGSGKVPPPPPTPPPAGPPPPTPSAAPPAALTRSSSMADSVSSMTTTGPGGAGPSPGPAPMVTVTAEDRQRTLDEIQRLQAKLTHIEAESHASSDLVATLEAALNDSERNLRKARTQLSEVTRERDAFSAQSGELQAQVDAATNELATTQARVLEQRQALEREIEQERAARDKARQALSARLEEVTKKKNSRLFCL